MALIILCCHNTICVTSDHSNFDMTNKPLREKRNSIKCSTIWPITTDIPSSNAASYTTNTIEITLAINYDF